LLELQGLLKPPALAVNNLGGAALLRGSAADACADVLLRGLGLQVVNAVVVTGEVLARGVRQIRMVGEQSVDTDPGKA
jgi:hypothetical protein